MLHAASSLLRNARNSSGLSQRDLAREAHTSQSVVARIELGENSPSWATLVRLLRATGFTLQATIERIPVVDRSVLGDVPRILRMSPEQRLQEVAEVSRFMAAVHRA